MKIVILQGAFLPVPPLRGGAVEKVWDIVGQQMAAVDNVVVHISKSYPGLPDSDFVHGVRHIRVKGYNTPSSGIKLKMLDLLYTIRAIRRIPTDADVIITNTFWSPILLRGKLGRKVYVDVSRVPKGQMKFYKHVGRYRANSRMVADMIAAEVPASVHPRIGMVPNPLPFTVTEQLDLSKKEPVILYTGRIHPEKGLELLIEAFKKLDAGWKLRIIGPWESSAGGGGEDYITKLRALAGQAAIEFTGPVYNIDDLNDHYRKASVFVYPSLADKGETFGLAPLEAMAWGAVPVVSGVPCFRDFITPGVNGLIFDHHAANRVDQLHHHLVTLTTNAELRKQLLAEAVKVNQSHSIPSIVNQFLKDFQNI
ncbi:MAG: glycosyltransferase family 4 protein [Chitinophagaceae bacterium]